MYCIKLWTYFVAFAFVIMNGPNVVIIDANKFDSIKLKTPI